MFTMLNQTLIDCLNCNISTIVLSDIENTYYNTKSNKCCKDCETDLKLARTLQYLIKFSENTECLVELDLACLIKC